MKFLKLFLIVMTLIMVILFFCVLIFVYSFEKIEIDNYEVDLHPFLEKLWDEPIHNSKNLLIDINKDGIEEELYFTILDYDKKENNKDEEIIFQIDNSEQIVQSTYHWAVRIHELGIADINLDGVNEILVYYSCNDISPISKGCFVYEYVNGDLVFYDDIAWGTMAYNKLINKLFVFWEIQSNPSISEITIY